MESRRVGGFRHVHAVINRVHHHLQHGGDNTAAARAAGHQPCLTVFDDNRRRHRRQRAFLRPHCVGIAAHQAIDVWRARFGGEIIHLVIHQNAGVTRHNAAAEGRVKRIGHRHRIAVFIDDRKMRRLVALIRREVARFNLLRRPRLIDINFLRQRFRVGLAGQRLPRHLHEIRVAQILGAVGVGVFFRLGHNLHRVGAAEAIFMQVEILKNIEDLHDVDPARRRRRHRIDLITAVVAAHRRALHRFVIRQIGFGDKPAVFGHLVGYLVGNRALIEGVRAIFGDKLQAFCKIRLHQFVALLVRIAVLLPENRLAGRVVRERLHAVGF